MSTVTSRVLAASAGRDRVSDAVKALALSLVIVGHSLAWTITADGRVINTLDEAPWLFPVTWVVQILPLFFLLAGDRLRSLARDPTADGAYRRIVRLVSPVLPLILITVVLAALISLLGPAPIAAAAGIIPVQIVWFLGVYLIAIAISPLLVRITRAWQFAALLLAIAGVDLLRVAVNPALGWANIVLVWSLFVALGMQLPRLRTLRPWLCAFGVLASVAVAIALIVLGPYSAALITTTALPGLTNLAPPTLVLASFGLAQVFALMLAWPLLERGLARDRVWVPVALFASRAMGLYLLHLLFIALAIGVLLLATSGASALSGAWWLTHAIVLSVAVACAWALAPPLTRAGAWLASALGHMAGHGGRHVLSRAPVGAVLVLAALGGVNLLLISESGVGSIVEWRRVVAIPYLPVASIAMLLLIVGASACSANSAGQHGRRQPP